MKSKITKSSKTVRKVVPPVTVASETRDDNWQSEREDYYQDDFVKAFDLTWLWIALGVLAALFILFYFVGPAIGGYRDDKAAALKSEQTATKMENKALTRMTTGRANTPITLPLQPTPSEYPSITSSALPPQPTLKTTHIPDPEGKNWNPQGTTYNTQQNYCVGDPLYDGYCTSGK